MRQKLSLFVILFLGFQTSFAQKAISIQVDTKKKHQEIDNIGTSSAWFAEFVGKYWADAEREKMAKWLFSKKLDAKGNPEGIGLSSFRFNIGGGTTELGDSSRIKDFRRRAESFLNADGTYDWTKQSGFIWFVKKAKEYGVKDLIAFSNTPPVHFTQNGLGYKTVKDYTSNLKSDQYKDFADFLSKVLKHFSAEGINFNYISPINEPQWDWLQ